ncbi:MAG: DUF192 domain-containing protein [Idiomarina sp.]|nr:DUF192 domain-containing protein [Idiomarina sp.]
MTEPICIANSQGSQTFIVEIADTDTRRAQGLMGRTEVPPMTGMLFVYSRPAQRGFWMYRTLVPLDIAFLNTEGEVQQVMQMMPCESRVAALCPSYRPNQAFSMALEMAAGQFEVHDISAGSRVFRGSCPAAIAPEQLRRPEH